MNWSLRQVISNLITIISRPFRTRCNPRSAKYKKIETQAPTYHLPNPLKMQDGRLVENVLDWHTNRRPEILQLFQEHVYGRAPAYDESTPFLLTSVDEHALCDIATRKEVRIGLAGELNEFSMTMLLYLPNRFKKEGKKSALFLGLNFFGNHTIHRDPAISITRNWIPTNRITRGRAPQTLRGIQASSWPLEFILNHGFGLATIYCGDIVPDRSDGLDISINKWFSNNRKHDAEEVTWAAISGWAWGLSRAMDYLQQDSDIDSEKIAVIGHSRLGKASLWAGAQDERFAMVISNESGCGGAALSRRRIGITIRRMNTMFPHWFCNKYKHYNDREGSLPIDQHQLICLIAPRPVYIASAQLDLPADPMGEFLATKHANSVYKLLGTQGLPSEEFPAVNMPIMGTIGFHLRKGGHGVKLFDWKQFVAFANKHFYSRQ